MYNLFDPTALRPINVEGATFYIKSLTYKSKTVLKNKLDSIRETNKDKSNEEISELIITELQNSLVDHIEVADKSYSLIEYIDLLEYYHDVQEVLSFLMFYCYGLTPDQIKNLKSSLDISTPVPARENAETTVGQVEKPA